MNISVLLLPKFIEASDVLDIKYAIHDTIRLGEFNNNIKLPNTTCEMFANFLNMRYHENLTPMVANEYN